jgi:hypothetical protein
MTLTFETTPSEKEMAIFCDAEGLDSLITQLQILKQHKGHVHLMTPSWSGNELTENKQVPENRLLHHIRITLLS